jgi:methyl coenzyme M reductase subunit C-like uncharacterized protein (methanogenesis marker protein 7)
MKTYYSIESAKKALEKTKGDENLVLAQGIAYAESLLEEKHCFFIDNKDTEDEHEIEIYNLNKLVNCMEKDKNWALRRLEIMVACGGPNVWVMIDRSDNVTVQCFWGDQVEIVLGQIENMFENVVEIYRYLLDY